MPMGVAQKAYLAISPRGEPLKSEPPGIGRGSKCLKCSKHVAVRAIQYEKNMGGSEVNQQGRKPEVVQ